MYRQGQNLIYEFLLTVIFGAICGRVYTEWCGLQPGQPNKVTTECMSQYLSIHNLTLILYGGPGAWDTQQEHSQGRVPIHQRAHKSRTKGNILWAISLGGNLYIMDETSKLIHIHRIEAGFTSSASEGSGNSAAC